MGSKNKRAKRVRPKLPKNWEALRTMSRDELISLGLGPWDDGLLLLLLLPHTWYDYIPEGLELVSIDGKAYTHKVYPRDEYNNIDWAAVNWGRHTGVNYTDDDHRGGFLAYGILVMEAPYQCVRGRVT